MERKGYPDGIIRYPVSVATQPESNHASQSDIDALNEWKKEQETAISDSVIKGIKEIEDFLSGISDTVTLKELLQSLRPMVVGEQLLFLEK